MHHRHRRAAAVTAGLAALLSSAAALAPAAHATVKTTSRPKAAAGWLARQLTGKHHDHYVEKFSGQTFANYGGTADGILAMDAAHVSQHAASRATSWLAAHVNGYVKDDPTVCGPQAGYEPGSLAKAMLIAEAQHRNVHAFGGVNLVKRLEADESTDADNPGLFADPSPECGYSSTITQALALVALSKDGAKADRPDQAAVRWLVDQQCKNGAYGSCSGSDPDSTGYALQALQAVGADKAAHGAAQFLLKQQKKSGGFPLTGTGVNTNSTALAVQGLLASGHTKAAHAGQAYIARNQEGCKAKASRRGSLDYQGKYVAASQLTATTQGTQALAGGVLGRISKGGAAGAAPVLHC